MSTRSLPTVLLISLSLMCVLRLTLATCPPGWVEAFNKCFLTLRSPWPFPWMDQQSAVEACRIIHPLSVLPSVHSIEENDFLLRLAEVGNRVWLGLTNVTFTAWEWMDGSPVDFLNFRSGEPNNAWGKEYCVIFNYSGDHRTWCDYPCHDCADHNCTASVICQIQAL